jgi:hypothetical protein
MANAPGGVFFMRLIMSYVGSPYVFYEFPKWIAPHASQVVTVNGKASAPLYPVITVVRSTGTVQVLVTDSNDEKKATSQKT